MQNQNPSHAREKARSDRATRAVFGRRLVSGAALLAVLVALIAYAGSASASSTAASTAATASAHVASAKPTAAQVSWAKATLTNLYKGEVQAPPTTGPKAVKGKNVWLINCPQVLEACTIITQGFDSAAKLLGWHLTLVDAKAQPNLFDSGVREAIAAKANAIVDTSYDCAHVKSGLLAAKAAHIPVIGYAAIDCPQPMFTAALDELGSINTAVYQDARGKAIADYTVARLLERGITGGQVVEIRSTDIQGNNYQWDAWQKEMKLRCPKCTLIPALFASAQVPNPASETWKSMLLAHPNAVAVSTLLDAWLPAGLEADLKGAQHKIPVVCCGDGIPLGITAIQSGAITADALWPHLFETWGVADTLNRIFAGVKAQNIPNEGGEIIFIDRSHNMPKGGSTVADVPLDYRATYKAIWDGTGAKH